MALEVIVTSEKKGSNQGGYCQIKEYPNVPNWRAYLKHCASTSIKQGTTSFTYTHQPFYEAVTFQMLNELGLHTPPFFVLLNKRNEGKNHNSYNTHHGFTSSKTQEICFSPSQGVKMDIKPGMPYYFVTQLMKIPEIEDVSAAEKIIERELAYLNVLQVSDVQGKKQNYIVDEVFESLHGNTLPKSNRLVVFYLDLGCSFVNAVNGSLQFHGRHCRPLEGKDLKKAIKNLSKYSLVGRGGYRSMSLADLVEMPRYIKIPVLNPRTEINLSNLISEDEIEEIVSRLASGVHSQLSKIKSFFYIVKNSEIANH